MTKYTKTKLETLGHSGPVSGVKPHTPDRKCLHAQLVNPDSDVDTRIKYLHVTKGWREHDRMPANQNAWKHVMQRAQKFNSKQVGA